MSGAPAISPLDPFIPSPEVRHRHAVTIHAPAEIVFEVARAFDMQTHPIVRAIFWLRGKLLGSRQPPSEQPGGLGPDALLAMGWGRLAETSGRLFIAGAVCQPWKADVVFTPLSPEQFAEYREPGFVKIAWTLEAVPLGPALTRLATETRAVSTDEEARARFRRYWRLLGGGIRAIRWLLLPAIRRRAESRWRTMKVASGA